MIILVIKGDSQYNAMRKAADIMIEAWRDNNHCVEVLDVSEMFDKQKLSEDEVYSLLSKGILSEKYNLIFSINGIAFNLVYKDKKLIDYAKCKVLGYYVDIPIAHLSRIAGHNGKNIYVSCIDKNHVKLLNECLPEVNDRVLFLPHRGFECPNIKEWDGREIDVFFPGTFHSYENEIDTIKKYPFPINEIGLDTLNYMLDNPRDFYGNAIKEVLQQHNIELSDDERLVLMQKLYCVYRAYYEFNRVVVLETLLAAGIRVTVCGRGWGEFASENPQNLEVLPPLSIDEVSSMMGNSKIVLNVCPVLNNSSHERIFSAMLSGAVCLTDRNPYLESIFREGEAVMYDLADIDTLPQKVFSIINDKEKSVRTAKRAYDLVYNRFRWQNLADEIVEIMTD